MAVSKIKQGLMTISIVIVLCFFIFYAIEVFYPSPEYQDFCDRTTYPGKMVFTQAQCEDASGTWTEWPCRTGDENCEPSGNCDFYKECKEDYDAVREPYERNVFFVSMVIGLVLLFAGLALKGASVSTGIMGGGVITLFIGLARYWGELNDYLRLVILGVILALLIWMGYTKVDKIKEPRESSSPRKAARKSKPTRKKSGKKKSKRR